MDIFFQDPSDVPLPPKEVHIRQLQAEPWPDGRRVRIYLEISPFQQRPSGEISVTDAQGEEVASLSIIETIDPKMEFTIHLRGPEPGGTYQVAATLFYPEKQAGQAESEDQAVDFSSLANLMVVDQAETSFTVGE